MKVWEHVPPQLPRSVPCPIAFVDEAPGDAEVVYGKPLQGGVGKLFDRICGQAGIERADCLLTHVFDRQLEGGLKKNCTKEPTWENATKLPGMGYLPADYPEQLARLEAEIVTSKPRVIVTLGGTALWTMTRNTHLTEMRGTVSTVKLGEVRCPLLPTFRPGIIFKQYKMRGTMVSDLKKALATATGTTPNLTPRELWLSPTMEDLERYFPRLEASSLISVDIETERDQVTKIGFASSMNSAIVVPFVTPLSVSHSYWTTLDEELEAWNWVRRVGALTVSKIFQNGGFDNFFLIRLFAYMWHWDEDLRLLHHALYPELPKSLAYMMSVYGFERPWKLWKGSLQNEKSDS